MGTIVSPNKILLGCIPDETSRKPIKSSARSQKAEGHQVSSHILLPITTLQQEFPLEGFRGSGFRV